MMTPWNPNLILHAAALLVAVAISATAGAQSPHLSDIHHRLVEKTGQEYVEARNEAMALPEGAFEDLLILLRLSPEHSLEQIVALILEARATHPEAAARFDHDLQHMLDNPDTRTRHGRPVYHIWRSREPKETHPLVYEAFLKLELPQGFDRLGLHTMTFMPNPDNIPFILHFATHQSMGALAWLVTATEGHPEERAWLRPLALDMYKENREAGKVTGAPAVVQMFRRFGTPRDLEILKELHEFEEGLMPAQGLVIGEWDEVGRAYATTRREYDQRRAALARANRVGEHHAVIQQLQQQVDQAQAAAHEAQRQFTANSLLRQLNESIEFLEARLRHLEAPADK